MNVTLTQQVTGDSRTVDGEDPAAIEQAVHELADDRPGMSHATVHEAADAIADGMHTVIHRPDSTPLSFADAMNFLSLDLDI